MSFELPTKCAAMDASPASVNRASTAVSAVLGWVAIDAIGYRNRTGQATSA